MMDEVLTVLDGTQLSAVDLSPPLCDGNGSTLTGAQVLELAESKISSSIFGLALPETVKSSALKRLGIADEGSFRGAELDREKAASTLRNFVAAVVDVLKDDPVVVAIFNGKAIRIFLEDEDDFAMLAENVFTDLDTEDRGKISRNEIKNALSQMGVAMGIPPLSEFPQLTEILKKNGAEGEEGLGQAQFANLLQPVLQEVADALAANPIVVVQNIKANNGTKLRKFLADGKQLNDAVEKIMQENQGRKDEQTSKDTIRSFLEKNGEELGLPSLQNDEIHLLYDAVLADTENEKITKECSKDEFMAFVKEILEKFTEHLEANPVFTDLSN
nr:Trigger factor like [Ipomoea batatas]